jgi:protein-S-isoprenylcysteine O-methyltransferase Ste14
VQWPLRVVQLAGLGFGTLAFEHLDGAEFMGFRQVWRYLSSREVAGNIEGLTQKELVAGGVYGIVRHPLYAAGIVIATLNPHITVNGLTITMLADLYFVFGMFIEERRFLAFYGGQYREYMKRVPRMVPRLCFSKGSGRH